MKDKNTAAILAFFFGWMGAHKFYLGQTGAGLVYLVFSLTTIPLFLSFIEFIILALMDRDEFNRRFNGSHSLPGPVVVNMLPPAHGHYPQPSYPPQQPYPPQPYGYPPGYPSTTPHGYPPGYYPPGTYPPGVYPQPQQTMQQQPSVPPAPQGDIIARLEKLNELRIAGLLTDDEFAQQKSRVLDQL